MPKKSKIKIRKNRKINTQHAGYLFAFNRLLKLLTPSILIKNFRSEISIALETYFGINGGLETLQKLNKSEIATVIENNKNKFKDIEINNSDIDEIDNIMLEENPNANKDVVAVNLKEEILNVANEAQTVEVSGDNISIKPDGIGEYYVVHSTPEEVAKISKELGTNLVAHAYLGGRYKLRSKKKYNKYNKRSKKQFGGGMVKRYLKKLKKVKWFWVVIGAGVIMWYYNLEI